MPEPPFLLRVNESFNSEILTGLLFSRRPEHIIPQRRTDAVSDMIVLEMMAQMILLQPQPRAAFHCQVVRRIMEHVVADITENQAGKYGGRQVSKNQKKQTIEKESQRDAYDGRHNEPPPIAGIIVMHAVNHIVQPPSPTSLRLVMEDVPMNEVLEERPEQNPKQK